MTRRAAYDVEWKVANIAAGIDRKQETMLYPSSRCKVDLPTKVPRKQHPVFDCDIIKNGGPQLYQLRMPFGGPDFGKYMEKRTIPMRAVELLKMMLPAFQGVVKIAKAGYVHQDIRPANMVVLEGVHPSMRIIDNSLTIPMSTVYKGSNADNWRYAFFTYPPEYQLFALLSKNTVLDHVPFNVVLKNANINNLGVDFFKYQDRLSYHIEVLKLYRWLLKQGADAAAKLTQVADRIDVFSLGASLIYVHKWVMMPQTSVKEAIYVDFVRALTVCDPRDRLSPKAAVKRLVATIKLLESV